MNLIDINLLPIKEKKSRFFVYSAAGILLVFFLISLYFFISYHNVQTKIERSKMNLSQTRKIVEIKQAQLVDSQSSKDLQELEGTIEKMDTYPIKTVPVLNELISQLPKRGFIQTFEYSERKVINLTVQFDTSREAAYYLHRLTGVEWIKEADLLELSTVEVSPEAELLDERPVLPRYIVQYALTLDSTLLQGLSDQDSSSLEGEGEE